MKNLKKVLAMVLAFACTFSMFAGAKVFEDVPAGSDYSEAVTMLSDLGIIQGKDDGKYHPEDTITRAEACAMIARLMTGDPNVSQYVGAQSFTDVAKGSWKDSAIGYCYINGIVIGVGNNKFEPDRAITDAEFVTMVVRAMGYETADMKQNYPFSYMSNAQAIGLLDGTNMVASTDALRGEDAQVIYNALFTDYARGAKLVNTTHGTSVETYPTLAESVWGLTRAAVGTWDKKDDETATLEYCKAHTWVVLGADPKADGHILAYPISDNDGDLYAMGKDDVEAVSFKYDGDASAVAGYQVELWGEGSHGEPEWNNKEDKYVWSEDWTIKAIKTVKGQTAYDYNASMADSKSDNGEIVLGEETLDLDAVASNAAKATDVYGVAQYLTEEYNNVKSINTDKEVEAVLNIRDGAQYKLMDWDSDGDVDWVVISQANYFKVESANSKRVTVVSMKIGTDDAFETETKSESQTWKLDDTTTIDNVDYEFKSEDTLEEGDIVEVTYSVSTDDDKELITATISKVEAETKSLDKVSTKGGLTLTFDDEEIAVAQNYEVGDTIVPANPAVYRDFNSEELGTDFALYMNRNGFIVYSDYATETANYAMVLDVADGSDVTGKRELAKVDLLLANDSVAKDVELTSGARVQDATGADRNDIYSSRKFVKEEMVVGNVYKYWTNEDGQITRMQAMFNDASIAEQGSKDTDRVNNDSYSYKSSTDRLQDSQKNYVASLEESDVIFAVKVAKDGSYIQGAADTDRGLYVNSGDVKAVKYDQIPDINMDANDADETKVAALDDRTTRTANWLQNDTNTYDGTFVVSADGNKAGSAALLGVDNFNKFAAGNTKIGLVTDISYTNSSDGKYVEVEVATNGKYETIESKKKVDFDDIVEVLGDGAVANESSKVSNGVFGSNVELDKYLQENAAYAEITTDADGNVTKVSFLNTKDGVAQANELVGNYYTVTRTVVTENKTKTFDHIDTLDATTPAIHYASKDELYSVDRMPIENSAIAEDAVYYTIDGTPTRMDGQYKNNQTLTVSAGFDGTPDIEVSDKASMLTASIDNRYTSDTYYVADIAFNGDDEIVAMFNFDEDMGEVASKDAVLASLNATTMQAGKTPLTMTVKTVNNEQSQAYTLSNVYKAGDSKKDAVKGLTASKYSGTATVSGDTVTITADRTVAAGKYAVDVLVNGKVATNLTFEVTSADVLVADELTLTDAQGKEVVGIDSAATEIFFKVTDKSGTAITDIDTNAVTVYRNAGQEVGYSVVKTLTPGVYQINLKAAAGTDKFTVQYAGKSMEGQAATTGLTIAAPSAITAFSQDAVEAAVTAAGAVEDAGWKVEVKKGDDIIPSEIKDGKVVINPTGLTKSGSYTITVTAGSVSKTQTLTVNKEALTGTVSDVSTGAATFKATVTSYADLSAEAQAEINKISAATVKNEGAISGLQTVSTFTANNDGTFNGELSASPNTSGKITVEATVSSDYIASLVFTGTVA